MSRSFLFLVTLLFANLALAQLPPETHESFRGTGVDDQACGVRIHRAGPVLINVRLTGPAKKFQFRKIGFVPILPDFTVIPDGGARTLEVFNSNEGGLFRKFSYEGNLPFTEEYTFDSDNVPEFREALNGPSVVAHIFFDYVDGELSRVRATSSVKALGVLIVDDYEYECEKED